MSDIKTKLIPIIGDKYEVFERMSSGGMGEIYWGLHRALNKRVAIKVIKHGQSDAPEMEERFFREARLAANLDHSGIIDIYDFGTEAGLAYLIMPFIDGVNLREKLNDEGRIGIKESLIMVMAITNALGYAHQKGIIHRDIKPSNIMIDKHGKVLLTDFGVSKSMEDNDLTVLGTIIGTPRYMSPEQIESGKCDNRSDLYALGLVFYEMITGVYPYNETDIAGLLYAQIHTIPPRPSEIIKDIPVALCDIIMKLLEKSPQNRFSSCQELYNELRKVPFSSRKNENIEKDLQIHERIGATRVLKKDSTFKNDFQKFDSKKLKKKYSVKFIFFIFVCIGVAVYAVWTMLMPVSEFFQKTDIAKEGGKDELLTKLPASVSENSDLDKLNSVQFTTKNLNSSPPDIENLFLKAQTTYSSGQIDSPSDDNALTYLSEIKKISADHKGANKLLSEIFAAYISKGESALHNGDMSLAQSYYDKAQGVSQAYNLSDKGLAQLGGQLKQAQARKVTEARLEHLMSKASSFFRSGQIDSPSDDNALTYLSEIKKISPDHKGANKLLSEIFAAYISKGESALHNGDMSLAQSYYDKAQGVSQAYNLSDKGLAQLGGQLKQAQARKVTEARLEHLMSKASSFFRSGQIDSPSDDNALTYLSEIKKISPDHKGANKLLSEIFAAYISKGESALQTDDLSLAQSYYDKAQGVSLAYNLSDKGLDDLNKKIIITKKEEKQQRLIQDHLSKARTLFATSNIDSPPNENALMYLSNIKDIDPHNKEADRLLNNIIDTYVDTGKTALLDDQLEEAQNFVKKALKIKLLYGINNENLVSFQKQIQEIQTQEPEKKQVKVWGTF